MSMESEGATSNIELGSVLACEGDLPLHETANFEAEPTSPKASAEQERETRLEAIAAEIESVLGTAIMRVAALVAEAHELHRYQHGDGGFEGWVERRLKMSRRTAYNLLDVHKRFGDQSVQILHTLPRSVLYLIAPDSVPEAARTEVIERAEAGEKLSHAQVKEIVTGHKNPPLPEEHLISVAATQALKELSVDVGWRVRLFPKRALAKRVSQVDRRALLASWQKLDPADQHFVAARARRRGCDHHLADVVGSLPPPVLDATRDAAQPELPKPSSPLAAAPENREPMSFDDAPAALNLLPTDFDGVDRAIDTLYGLWGKLALRAIEDAHTVRKVKAIHDKAAGWEMHSHHTRNADAECLYREIRLHAERKGGQLLIYTKKKGLRFTGRSPKGLKVGMLPPDQDTLKKYGITRKESQQWQRTARMTERKFKALLAGKPARCRLPSRRHRGKRLRPAA
jgi:hypothetical protein